MRYMGFRRNTINLFVSYARFVSATNEQTFRLFRSHSKKLAFLMERVRAFFFLPSQYKSIYPFSIYFLCTRCWWWSYCEGAHALKHIKTRLMVVNAVVINSEINTHSNKLIWCVLSNVDGSTLWFLSVFKMTFFFSLDVSFLNSASKNLCKLFASRFTVVMPFRLLYVFNQVYYGCLFFIRNRHSSNDNVLNAMLSTNVIFM